MKITVKDFYAVICDDSQYRGKNDKHDPLLCAVLSSKEEAEKLMEHPVLKSCLCKHYIKKCIATVEYI